MSFSDKDLKRLKAFHYSQEVDALILRLEAAERLMDFVECCCPKEAHYKNCNFRELWEAWLLSAGKGSE